MKDPVYLELKTTKSVTFGGIDRKIAAITLHRSEWEKLGQPTELVIEVKKGYGNE